LGSKDGYKSISSSYKCNNQAVREVGHLLTRSGFVCPVVSSKTFPSSLNNVICNLILFRKPVASNFVEIFKQIDFILEN
jgi:hypothetical protein